MQSINCQKCGKRLFDGEIDTGEVEIICPKCGSKNRLRAVLKPFVTITLLEKEQNR